MDIFQILENLFTNKSSDWILSVEDRDINPFVIQKFLVLNNKSIKKARISNPFVFNISPKQYLSIIWSLLFFDGKKLNKSPYIKYPKNNNSSNIKYWFIYNKFQKQYNMSDKDIRVALPFLKKEIDKDKPKWFAYYGIVNKHWVENEIDIDLARNYCKRPEGKNTKGLYAYF